MRRVFNVATGACLVFLLWTWMLAFPNNFQGPAWWAMLFGKVYCACMITVPLYREYLK